MDEETPRHLRRLGYFASLKRHGRGRIRAPFPDLSVPPRHVPDLSTFRNPTPKRHPLPPDAKQFPVGNSHKQGLELITPKSNPADYNGAKK